MQAVLSVEELMSFELPLETAFANMLKDAGITNIFPSRSTLTADTPWVEVSLITGDALRHGKIHSLGFEQAGNMSPDAWSGDLVLKITTNRGTNGDIHKVFIGKIRDRMRLRRILAAWNVSSPYRIGWIEGGGSKKYSDDEQNLDITEMTYRLNFNIHPDAWPE